MLYGLCPGVRIADGLPVPVRLLRWRFACLEFYMDDQVIRAMRELVFAAMDWIVGLGVVIVILLALILWRVW